MYTKEMLRDHVITSILIVILLRCKATDMFKIVQSKYNNIKYTNNKLKWNEFKAFCIPLIWFLVLVYFFRCINDLFWNSWILCTLMIKKPIHMKASNDDIVENMKWQWCDIVCWNYLNMHCHRISTSMHKISSY